MECLQLYNRTVSGAAWGIYTALTWLLASFPDRLPLRSLDAYVTFEPPGEAGEGLVYNYIFYVIKPHGGLDHDICGLGFSNYGNVPLHQIAIDSKRHKTTLLLFHFIATTRKTVP